MFYAFRVLFEGVAFPRSSGACAVSVQTLLWRALDSSRYHPKQVQNTEYLPVDGNATSIWTPLEISMVQELQELEAQEPSRTPIPGPSWPRFLSIYVHIAFTPRMTYLPDDSCISNWGLHRVQCVIICVFLGCVCV